MAERDHRKNHLKHIPDNTFDRYLSSLCTLSMDTLALVHGLSHRIDTWSSFSFPSLNDELIHTISTWGKFCEGWECPARELGIVIEDEKGQLLYGIQNIIFYHGQPGLALEDQNVSGLIIADNEHQKGGIYHRRHACFVKDHQGVFRLSNVGKRGIKLSDFPIKAEPEKGRFLYRVASNSKA